MLLSVGLLALSQVAQVFSAPMTLGTKGLERRNASTACKAANNTPDPSDPAARTEYRRYKQHDFKTKDTDKFVVNGSGLPDVDFDIGTSFAGSIPLAKNNATGQDMFFWFFPSTVDLPEPEIPLIVWLNGGPGCSSMEGVLQENGPFVWSPGAYKPVRNPFSWNNLAHILYVDQPVGTGFSQGKVTAENDEDAAKQFAEFLKRFQETFAIKGKKIYLAGESYAGYFHPYIGREMIHRQDKDYFDFQGALLFNPALNSVLNSAALPSLVKKWKDLLGVDDATLSQIDDMDKQCGITEFAEKNLIFPPPKDPFPVFPYRNRSNHICNSFINIAQGRLLERNPCFDPYHIPTTCPVPWDVSGGPGRYTPDSPGIYFARPDVQRAIHAPTSVVYQTCGSKSYFDPALNKTVAQSSSSQLPILAALPEIIEHSQNVIVASGSMDTVVPTNGTLLALQNMTWGGHRGFQSSPFQGQRGENLWSVPTYNGSAQSFPTASPGIVQGVTHAERGLTFAQVKLAGHSVPMYAPASAYRLAEVLLGRAGLGDEKVRDVDMPPRYYGVTVDSAYDV